MGDAGPRQLAELLPGGRFGSLAGVGHLPWLEDATELSLQLRGFVEQFS